MEVGIGTLDPVDVGPEKRKHRSSRQVTRGGGSPGGSGGSGGDRGGYGGGGGDSSGYQDAPDNSEYRDKSRILTGFLLLVVLMTFGGLMGAYVVVATNRALEWNPFELPAQIWISTILIVASSLTYEFGKRAIFSGDIPATRRWMVATTVLGAMFVASQLLVWMILVGRGFYMSGNPYAGFFYILTAAHAIHVIGGIIALGAVLLRSWERHRSEEEFTYRSNLARSVGWYWHFMGALWIVLFLLLGFWK